MKYGIIIYSADSSSDSLDSKSSLIVFTIFLFFIPYLHASKSIYGKYSLSELTKIESNNITDKHAQYSLSLGILLCWKFVYTLLL